MPALTPSEKRTIRISLIVLIGALAVVFGSRSLRALEARRAQYHDRLFEAQRLQRDVLPIEKRAFLAGKLKENFRFDPGKLSRASLVAEASAAIQTAAKRQGIRLGPMRESPARSTARELSSIQLEGVGPVPAVMTLLHRLESVGSPVIVDSVQLTPDAKPGQIKVSLTLVILDYDQWKKEEPPRA